MLVDISNITAQISSEYEKINIEDTAKNLRGLKQMMGPVTVLWYDYVIYNAKLPAEKMRKLIEFAEADIRRTVKKDKSQPSYGSIVAFFALKCTELKDFALEYCKLLNIDITGFKELINLPTNDAILGMLEKILPPEIAEIITEIKIQGRINYFKRFARRSRDLIAQRLDSAMLMFQRILEERRRDSDELEAV